MRASVEARVDARPRWLADEMLGRLARYLRFLGFDTEYARGGGDGAIAAQARAEDRVLLTRDRRLARAVPGAVLVEGTAIAGQLRSLRDRYPDLSFSPTFERCTACNGRLEPEAATGVDPGPVPVPADVRRRGVAILRCARCGHAYWEGSHTARIRRTVAEALASA